MAKESNTPRNRPGLPRLIVAGFFLCVFLSVAANIYSPMSSYSAFFHVPVESIYGDAPFLMLGQDTPNSVLQKLYAVIGGNITLSLIILLEQAFSTNKTLHRAVDLEVDTQERCMRYGFQYNASRPIQERRIFWGSLIADDSWHTVALAAMEYYDLMDTIVFVESNTTQTLSRREMRYLAGSPSLEVLLSPLLWGSGARVHVDYFYISPEGRKAAELARENLQRDKIIERWKSNGMGPDDIGFISDIDEIASRDFLVALKTCDVPLFQEGQDCWRSKMALSTLVFEGSLKCVQDGRRWYHPDFVVGECVDSIGNETEHPPVPRVQRYGAMMHPEEMDRTMHHNRSGPLWDATDFRMRIGGGMFSGRGNLHTAFHLHNFFESLSILRNKYLTYGHPVSNAKTVPMSEFTSDDVKFMVDCLNDGNTSYYTGPHKQNSKVWNTVPALHKPLAVQYLPDYISLRHKELQLDLKKDEEQHGK